MTEAFKQAMLAILNKHQKVTVLSGTAVNVTDNDFDVEMEGKPDIYGARINAAVSDINNYVKIIPAESSNVLVGIIENNDTEAILISTSEISKIIIKIGDAEFKIEGGKYTLKNNNADCKQILLDLLNELKSAIIQTPAGPGNFSPSNVNKFNEITQKVNQLFE